MAYRRPFLTEESVSSADEQQTCEIDTSGRRVFNEIWVCDNASPRKSGRQPLTPKQHKVLARFIADKEVPLGHKTDSIDHRDAFDEWLLKQGIPDDKSDEAATHLRKRIRQAAKNLASYYQAFLRGWLVFYTASAVPTWVRVRVGHV